MSLLEEFFNDVMDKNGEADPMEKFLARFALIALLGGSFFAILAISL